MDKSKFLKLEKIPKMEYNKFIKIEQIPLNGI